MGIKLEEGKTYVTRDGRVVGPMRLLNKSDQWRPTSYSDITLGGFLWDGQGCRYYQWHKENPEDLVEEYKPMIKLKDLLEVEQLKLRVAFLEGKPVQYYEEAFGYEGWNNFSGDSLDDNLYYRLNSYLPLEVGKTYKSQKGNFKAIAECGDNVWMTMDSMRDAAYVWNKSTGKAVSLSIDSGYNVIGVVD